MAREGQQSLIEAAQRELMNLKGSGRRLLEAIAEAKDIDASAQQAASIIESAEQSLERVEKLDQKLSIPAAPNSTSFQGTESRRSLLQKRKAELEGHPEKRRQPQRPRWKGLKPAGIMQRIMDHSVAVTGYLVHGISSIGDRVSAYEASSLVMEIPQVLTAVIALASTGVPEAVHVAVMSPAEVAMGRSHWAGSRHEVFRRISDVALHALRHFTESAQCSEGDSTAEAEHDGSQKAEALQSILLWLASYRDLFRAPCRATGQLLALDFQTQQLLPPVVRPFEIDPGEMEMIAEGCMGAAAYHVHTQPQARVQSIL